MYHMNVRMKECLNISDKRKPVYGDVPHQASFTEDSFPTSFHSQLSKSLPSLKGKCLQFLLGSAIKRKSKKESQKKKKSTLSEFQTLTRFSSRDA